MYTIENAKFAYRKGKPVVESLQLELHAGRIYGLLGRNGSGKTTLLRLMAGQLLAQEGKLSLNGCDVRRREPETMQEIVLMSGPTRFWNLTLEQHAHAYANFYPRFDTAVLNDCLDAFGLKPLPASLSQLSLGNSQKVMFSLTLACRPAVQLLDEPFNGLDIPSRAMLRQLLMRHCDERQLVVISTHTVGDVEHLLSDLIMLRPPMPPMAASLSELGRKYAAGLQASPQGALHAEACAEGYRVLRENTTGTESELPLDLLFNAINQNHLP